MIRICPSLISQCLLVMVLPGVSLFGMAWAADNSPPWEEPLLPGPVYSARELAWRSSLIITLKIDKAGDLQVDQVLQGTWDAQAPPPLGDGIQWVPSAPRGVGYWRRVDKSFELLPSGLRSQGPSDTVEYASPRLPWKTVPGSTWSTYIKELKSDLDQIQDLKAAWRENQAPKRIEKIQNWISRNESSLGGGITEGQGTGWGSLEQTALMEIIQGADLESAWKAIGIYARSNEGYLPPCGPAFSTPERRNFLLEIAQSQKRLMGERARAVRVLGAKGVWKGGPTEAETKRFNEILIGALKQNDPIFFESALETVLASGPNAPFPLNDSMRDTLKGLYQSSTTGPRKAALGKALANVLGKEGWKTLSGNEGALVLAFTQMALSNDRLHWKLEKLNGEAPPQKVTLLREKLDNSGNVVESATLPAQDMDNPLWKSTVPLRGEWPILPWTAGLWRVKAIGGDPKKPAWQSEARMVRVTKPAQLPFLSRPAPAGSTKVVIDPPSEK